MVYFAITSTLYWVVIIPVGNLIVEGSPLPMALGGFIGLLILYLILSLEFRPVWRYVYSHHRDKAVLERLKAALRDNDLDYSMYGPHKRLFFKMKGEVLDLDPMQIVIERGKGLTTVYLGPLMDGSEEEVKRLKVLIDRALG